MEKYCFNCHRHGKADCPSIAGDAACYTFEMQPAVKNCHRWIKEGSAAEERGTIDKQTTNTRSPKLVDTLEQLIGHASFDSAENLLAVIGIINQLRAGA